MPLFSGPTRDSSIRTTLIPGDIDSIIHLHRTTYAIEYGFNQSFADYVARPLTQLERARNQPGAERDCLWIAEKAGGLAGCIAIVRSSNQEAQLRWFLVDPQARRQGLGGSQLRQALEFCAVAGYLSVYLWTVQALTSASRLYRAAGFVKVEERHGKPWGVPVVEEKYQLDLDQKTPAN